MKYAALLAVPALLMVAACDSKKENAAEVKDAQAGATVGEDSAGMGPREAAADHADATSGTMATPGAGMATGTATTGAVAEQKADNMENQADAVRKSAEAKADKMEDQADAVRDAASK